MNDQLGKTYQQIEEATQNLRSALNNHLAEFERTLREDSGDVNAKVEERKYQARQLQFDKKLTELFDEIKYYPNWSQREDWLSIRLCEIDNPEGTKIDNETQVAFLLRGQAYRFIYLDEGRRTGFDGDDFHHTQLSLRDHAGRLLIEIDISVEYDHFWVTTTELKPFGVSAFLPGPWIQDFLECYEKFQANKKARELKRKYEEGKVRELKEKLGLQ
jgi:hypothetical protein